MCELYLSSASAPHFPETELRQLQRHGGSPWTNLQGWGAAWLQGKGPDAGFGLEKHPQPALGAVGYQGILRDANHSPVWLIHLRAASSGGVSRANTQPYRFAWPEHEGPHASAPSSHPQRRGAFMHNGELKKMQARLIERFGEDPRHGTADSEGGMILLRDALAAVDTAEAAWGVFGNWVDAMRAMGQANFIVALGRDVFAHSHRRTELGGSAPDDTGLFMGHDDGEDGDRLRLSSEPFADDDEPLSNGTLLWIRDGAVVRRGVTV